MKKFVLTILPVLFFCSTGFTQNYWQALPVSFEYATRQMYYDSIDEKSYIFGSFKVFNGDSANVVVYDGIDYDTLPRAPLWSIRSMVRYKNKLYLGGNHAGLAVWDGVNWSIIEQDGLFNNLRVYDDKLYALGNFDKVGNVPCRGVAVWNDTVWTGFREIDSIIPTGSFTDDLIFYKNSVYVCGNFFNPAYPNLEDIMMHDGQSWQPVGDFRTDGLGSLRRMLIWRDTLYVAGIMAESGNAPGNCIAAWDGQQWHRLQHGVAGVNSAAAVIEDMIVYNDELWVGGMFYIINGRFVDYNYGGVAKWDGSQWCTMGLRKQGIIKNFGRWKEELFIVGEFVLESNPNAARVVKWTGGNYTDTCNQNFSVSIAEKGNETPAFDIYPNPAKDKIFISFSESIKPGMNVSVQITDVLGRVVFTTEFKSDKGQNSIDISGMALGTYYVCISGGGMVKVEKMVIQ